MPSDVVDNEEWEGELEVGSGGNWGWGTWSGNWGGELGVGNWGWGTGGGELGIWN